MAEQPFEDFLTLVGGWEGFDVAALRKEDEPQPDVLGAPSGRIVKELRPRSDAVKRCSRCGTPVAEIHDVVERRVRDVALLDRDTWLVFPMARLRCPRCGPTGERIPWLDRYQRMTKRLAEKIAGLAQVLPNKHVAAWFGVSWDTVKAIDKRALVARLGPVTTASLAEVSVIGIDEFALRRGHRHATVVTDLRAGKVLWVGRGRRREDLRPFFELLGPAGRARIKAVVIDMSGDYSDEVCAQCPQAELVHDLFHVVAKYGREVIDRVRVDETNRIARANGPNDHVTRARRRVLEGTRWPGPPPADPPRGIAAVTWVRETHVVLRGVPFHRTLASAANPVPAIVTTVVAEPQRRTPATWTARWRGVLQRHVGASPSSPHSRPRCLPSPRGHRGPFQRSEKPPWGPSCSR